MKKAVVFVGIVLIGSTLTAAIDALVGISFKDVGLPAQITHKTAYILWGSLFVGAIRRLWL